MTPELEAAARAVQADFLPAEASADRAAAQTARLLTTLLEQRAAAGLAIGTGAPLIRKLAKGLTAQLEARDEFIMAHKLAAALPGELGIPPRQFGDTEPCPDVDGERRYWAALDKRALGDHASENVVRLAGR